MNRISKEYLSGGKNTNNTPALLLSQQHHRRGGRNLIGGGGGNGVGGGGGRGGLSRNTDESLDLFSRNDDDDDDDDDAAAGSASSDEPPPDAIAVSMKLGRLSVGVGSAKVASSRSGMDDLLSSVEGGKHDYDWLLTPPGTPLFSSSDASEHQPTSAGPRKSSSVRSVSTTKSSRLSITQPENGHSSRPTRSTSVTRPSASSVNYNTYSSNKSSSVLNTSSGSVTSISRPSTPGARGSVSSNARPSTPSGRSMPSRPLTPAKSRPTTAASSGEKTRVSQVSRPSTPTSRPQIHANLNSPVARSNSRPSTPTRRNPASGPPAVIGRSASVGRALTNGRNVALASRGSSPGPRTRSTQQPIVPLDFPLDTPPNLRTTLPDRPISTGRSRPNVAPAVRGIPDLPGPINQPRRQSSSPIVTRGRHPELSAKARLQASGHNISAADNQKTTPVSDPAIRRSTKPATAIESTGFGRTISKKSLDMALRHMDIRQGSGGVRPLSGTTLFPQSVRSGTAKGQRARVWDSPPPPPPSMSTNCIGRPPVHGGNATTYAENGNCIDGSRDAETEEEVGRLSAKVNVPDIYESSRYDTILLKEDLKNTNWLHSIDDKSDMGLLFDHRFESLPEPFDPL